MNDAADVWYSVRMLHQLVIALLVEGLIVTIVIVGSLIVDEFSAR